MQTYVMSMCNVQNIMSSPGNIHCEVQVILLQKSWYVMRGSVVQVMYSMKEQARTKMKNIDYEVQVRLQWKFWYIMTGCAGVVFHKRETSK